MFSANETYSKKLGEYKPVDGIKAIFIYAVIMGSAFLQGWLYTTDVSISLLDSCQIWIPLALLLIIFVFFFITKERLRNVGLTTTNLLQSLLLGGLGGIILLVFKVITQGHHFSVIFPPLLTWLVFIIGAFEEEVYFRGYIQTRLSGLIRYEWIAVMITGVLFVLLHYPVRWMVTGRVSFSDLSALYIASLFVLHLFCAWVYRKTNCLWGAVLLHLIHNAGGSMMFFS